MTDRESKFLEYLKDFKEEAAMNLDWANEEYYQGQYRAALEIIGKFKEIFGNDESRND